MIERAEEILRRASQEGEETLLRNNLLIELGGPIARATLPERRKWAEAWQLLENAGFLCREPDSQGRESYFLTGRGRQAANSDDLKGELLLAGVQA